jgi:hypothetical protein
VTLPVASDLPALLTRLEAEERARQETLAGLEARLRTFEDVERPAYDRWLRGELGSALAGLDAVKETLRARRATVERVMALADREGWRPHEALYVVLHPQDVAPPSRRDRVDPDEVAARRRAKVERKRADRKAAQRARRDAEPATTAGPSGAEVTRARRVSVFRAVARRLHPDSPTVARFLEPSRAKTLWAEASVAYAAGNLDRLLSIATWLDAEGGGADGIVPSSLSERYERLRALERSTRAIERRLAELAGDPAWEFSRRTVRDRRRTLAAAARALDEERAAVEAALREVEADLAALGSPRPPRRR